MTRRMFSTDIVGSDAFLEMPISSRELYFQLNMYADDDGFVNPKKIMRIVGASDDDLKILLVKRFALTFENGVVVIKHWLIHNMIRKDRYTETKYIDQKNTLVIKDNKAYTELRQPTGNQSATQYRLGKDRLGKDRENTDGDKSPTPAQEARDFFSGKDSKTYKEIFNIFLEKTKVPESVLMREFDKFCLYWTEKNKSGTKQLWETKPTFEVKRRLVTWLNNNKQFNSNKTTGRGVA